MFAISGLRIGESARFRGVHYALTERHRQDQGCYFRVMTTCSHVNKQKEVISYLDPSAEIGIHCPSF